MQNKQKIVKSPTVKTNSSQKINTKPSSSFNKQDFQNEWNDCSILFEQSVNSFNSSQISFRSQLFQVYEGFTEKVLENLSNPEQISRIKFTFAENPFVFYKRKNNPMSIFYVDFLVYYIKKKVKKETGKLLSPMEQFLETQIKTKEENFVFIREFSLMLFKENEIFISEGKLNRIALRLNELMLKRYAFKCFVQYFFLILVLKNSFTFFSSVIVEILEDWIMNNIAYLSENGKNDEASLFYLLYITYEIFCWSFQSGISHFSLKFIKFFTSLGIWHTEKFWEKVIFMCTEFYSGKEECYYVNILKSKAIKSRIKSIISIYEMLIFMAFCFLKIPLTTVLNIFNSINEKNKHLSINHIFDISRAIEPRMFEKTKNRFAAFSERSIFFQKDSTASMFVIKRSMEYFQNPCECFKLLYISKDFSKYLRSKILKLILMSDNINGDLRFKFWVEISKISHNKQQLVQPPKNDEADPKILHIIKMDVKRTNFVKVNKEILEKMLISIATDFPLTTYYQGMNCIGGFLLNFTDNEEISYKVFYFLMRKRLEVYFLNNFEKLKKLLYIAERIIQVYVPKLHDRFFELKIGIEFYISPILLTIFTSSLQFIENYSMIAKIIDVFISKGWVGFFKVMVYVFRLLEKQIVDKDYDRVLEFLNKGIYESLFKMKLENIKSECNKIVIMEREIYQLGLEFDRTRHVVETYWASYYENKRKIKENGESSKS